MKFRRIWANNIKPYPVGLFLGYLNVAPVSCRHLEELIARSGVVSRERDDGLGSLSLSGVLFCAVTVYISGNIFKRWGPG